MSTPEVDWRQLRGHLRARVNILEAAWNDALKRGQLGEKMIADLYMPILRSLVPFLASFKDDDGGVMRVQE